MQNAGGGEDRHISQWQFFPACRKSTAPGLWYHAPLDVGELTGVPILCTCGFHLRIRDDRCKKHLTQTCPQNTALHHDSQARLSLPYRAADGEANMVTELLGYYDN